MFLLYLHHQLPYRLPLTMHRGRLAVRGGIAHTDHRHQLIALSAREDVPQQGRVERADPKGGQALVLSQHQISGDDGGVYLGAVLPFKRLSHASAGWQPTTKSGGAP